MKEITIRLNPVECSGLKKVLAALEEAALWTSTPDKSFLIFCSGGTKDIVLDTTLPERLRLKDISRRLSGSMKGESF